MEPTSPITPLLTRKKAHRLHMLSLLESCRLTSTQAAEALGPTPRRPRYLRRPLHQRGQAGLAHGNRASAEPRPPAPAGPTVWRRGGRTFSWCKARGWVSAGKVIAVDVQDGNLAGGPAQGLRRPDQWRGWWRRHLPDLIRCNGAAAANAAYGVAADVHPGESGSLKPPAWATPAGRCGACPPSLGPSSAAS